MLQQLLSLLPSSLCYLLHHGAANTTSATDCFCHCHCPCCQLIVASVVVSSVDCCFSKFAVMVPSCLCSCRCCGYHRLCCTLRHSIAKHHWCCCWLLSLPFVIVASCRLIVASILIAATLSMLQPLLALPWLSLLPCCTVGWRHGSCHYCCRLIDKSCSSFAVAVIAVATMLLPVFLLSHLFCSPHLDLAEDTVITTSQLPRY